MPLHDQFLLELFKDAQEQMRWKAKNELRYVEFFTVIIGVVIAGMIAFSNLNVSVISYLLVAVMVISFILFYYRAICSKIEMEHLGYGEWGEVVQKIWIYFECFTPGAYIRDDSIIPGNWNSVEQQGLKSSLDHPGYGHTTYGFERTKKLFFMKLL